MSMLSSQCDELRKKADMLDGFKGMDDFVRMLREAADTIERLRDRLQELQGVGGESNYTRLFGTPERAARTFSESAQACYVLRDCDRCPLGADENCMHSEKVDEQKLLEWLRGDA